MTNPSAATADRVFLLSADSAFSSAAGQMLKDDGGFDVAHLTTGKEVLDRLSGSEPPAPLLIVLDLHESVVSEVNEVLERIAGTIEWQSIVLVGVDGESLEGVREGLTLVFEKNKLWRLLRFAKHVALVDRRSR